MSSGDLPTFRADQPPSPPVRQERELRWWLALLTVVAVNVAGVIVSSIFVAVAFIAMSGPGAFSEGVESVNERLMSSSLGSTLLVLPNQLIFAGSALLLGVFLGPSWRRRYRLVRPAAPPRLWISAALGSIVVGIVPSLVFNSIVDDPSRYFRSMLDWFQYHRGAKAIYFVLLISVTPGICEELLFRGFLFSALERQLRLWMAVLLTSFMFAAAHLNPFHALLVLPLGIWLTMLARAFDSLLVPIAAHILNNIVAVSLTLMLDGAETWSDPPILIALGIGLAALTMGLRATLRGLGRPAPSLAATAVAASPSIGDDAPFVAKIVDEENEP